MKLKVNESFTNPKETNPEKLAKTVMGWYDFDTNYIDDGGQRRTAEKKNQNTLEWFNEHPLELKQKAYKILLSKVHSSEKAKVQNTFGKLISEVSATPNTNELKMKNIKETIKSIVKEESEYEVFFRKALDKAGKKITDMNDDEKKAFFTKIDTAWTGKGEKNEGNAFGAERAKAIAKGDDSFKVDGKPFKVTGVDAEDKENAEKFSNESIVNEQSDPLELKGIKINKKSPITFVLEVSFVINGDVAVSYLTTGTQQDAQKLKSKLEKAFEAGKIVSPSGIGYYAYNESVINEEKYTVIDPKGNQMGASDKGQAVAIAKKKGGEKEGYFVVSNKNALKARRALEKFKGDFKNPKLKDMMADLFYESVESVNEATLEQGTKLRYDKNSNVVDYVVDKKYTGRDGFPKYILKVVKSNTKNIKVGSTIEYDDARLTGLIRNRVMSFVKNESVNEDFQPVILKLGNPKLLKVGEEITINTDGKKKEYKVVKSNGNGDFVLHPVNESVESVNEEILKPGTKVKLQHKGKTVSGKIVRYDDRTPGSPFYIVYTGEYSSIEVPAHQVTKESVEEATTSSAPGEWVAYLSMARGKKLLKTFDTARGAKMFLSKNVDKLLGGANVESVGIMTKKQWDEREAKYAIESVVSEGKFEPNFAKKIEALIKKELGVSNLEAIGPRTGRVMNRQDYYFHIPNPTHGIVVSKKWWGEPYPDVYYVSLTNRLGQSQQETEVDYIEDENVVLKTVSAIAKKYKKQLTYAAMSETKSVTEAISDKDLPNWLFDDPIDFEDWYEDGMELANNKGKLAPFSSSDEKKLFQLVGMWQDAEGDYQFGRGDLGTGKTTGARSASYSAQDLIKKFLTQKGKVVKTEGNTFGAERAKAIANGDDSFKVDGKPFKVTGVDAEDKENAKKFSNENTELPKATIPAAVQAKLDMAIEKIKDTKLSYNQKLSLIGKVMDGLGVDKGEFNKMASKLKGTMESVITEQLVPVDKKAVDAFFDKKPFEGKNLNSDGKVLKTVGVGSQEMFIHTPNGVKFVGKITGQYAQSVVQYVNKNYKSDLTEIIKSYKPGDGEYIAKIYSGHLKGDERYSHALTVVDVLHANGLVTKAVAKQMEQELANSLARLRKSRSENVNEGNAFGMAVNAAKKEGLKEFEFNGKMYKVKTGSYEKNEAAKKPVVLSGFTLVPEKKK